MKKILFITMCMLLLAGCAEKEKMQKSVKENVAEEADGGNKQEKEEKTQNIQKVWKEQLTEKVSADFTIEQEIQKEYPIYDVEYPVYDLVSVKETLFPEDKSEYTKSEEESNGYKNMVLQTQSGISMMSSPGYLSASTQESLYYGEFIYLNEEENDSRDAELAFMSRKDIEELCRNYLQKVGDFSVYSAEIIAYTGEYLEIASKKAKEEVRMQYERDNWTEEEEAYLVKFRIEVSNLPVLSEMNGLVTGKEMIPVECVMLVNRHGVQDFYIKMPIAIEEIECVEIIEVSQALEAIKNRFDIIVMDNDMKINRAELMYVLNEAGIDKYQLVPSWAFYMEEKITYETNAGEEKTVDRNHVYFINAVTGEIIN